MYENRPVKYLAACLSIATTLAGCGFHLQGKQPMPAAFAFTYIDTTDEQTDFVQDLRKALLASGSKVIRTKGSSGATVSVHEDELTERILSVSARNIPTEYELTYTVTFAVRNAEKELLAPQTVSLSKDYSFDEHFQLAKEHEADILKQQMAHDLVAIAMHRLTSLK